jgi:Zn-dependent peptidase ImmA (M78 family)
MSKQPSRILAAAEANRVWKLYGFTSPADLVLEDLAMALGIVVMDGPLESAAARLVRSGNTGLVRIAQSIRETGRRRFAIAHEIGHWILHKDQSQLLACTNVDMLASYKSSPLEVEASIFAGALLMPDHLFVTAVANARPTARLIRRLATHFSTSLTATALRYVETSDDYCAFVISEKNRIRWWRASQSFGDHELWMEARSELPRQSVAASFFLGEPLPDEPQAVDLHAWFGELAGIDGDTVVEQAIALGDYGQVLSLLWLP